MPYRIEYSPEAEKHLRFLTTRQRATVLNGVDEQLLHEPTVETRVHIRAVGIKERSRVRIGKEVIELST